MFLWVHIHTHTHKHTFTCIYMGLHADTFMRIRTHSNLYTSLYIYICVYTRMHFHRHTYTRVYIHTCMHTYIHGLRFSEEEAPFGRRKANLQPKYKICFLTWNAQEGIQFFPHPPLRRNWSFSFPCQAPGKKLARRQKAEPFAGGQGATCREISLPPKAKPHLGNMGPQMHTKQVLFWGILLLMERELIGFSNMVYTLPSLQVAHKCHSLQTMVQKLKSSSWQLGSGLDTSAEGLPTIAGDLNRCPVVLLALAQG